MKEKLIITDENCTCNSSPLPVEGWEVELAPKVTNLGGYEPRVVEFVHAALDDYWQKLKPYIKNLLASQRQLLAKEIEQKFYGANDPKVKDIIGYLQDNTDELGR